MPSKLTGKQILSHIYNNYPIRYASLSSSVPTNSNRFAGKDYGWLWYIQDAAPNGKASSGRAFDKDGNGPNIDIEIVTREGTYDAFNRYIVKIYPNRMKNLRFRCQELLRVLSENNMVNGNSCFPGVFEKGGGNSVGRSVWSRTDLPGGNNKIWKKPDLGSIPLLASLYPKIGSGDSPQIKLSYPQAEEVRFHNKTLVQRTWDDAHPISQIERYSPMSIIENNRPSDRDGYGLKIEMHVKNIVAKNERFDIAEYFGKNIIASTFYDYIYGQSVVEKLVYE
jgi:hypothetical protein